MTIEQKFLLTAVALVCLVFISLVMYFTKRQEFNIIKRNYNKLLGDYSHLKSSVNLVGKIKQSEGMKVSFESDVNVGDLIYTKEYSEDGKVMSGKVVTICWFGKTNYTFIVAFEGDISLEFPSSSLGKTAFFTPEAAEKSEPKHKYSDFDIEDINEEV